jgi:guanylate kinase
MPDRQTKRRGCMFVLSSPSGAGKTTISRLLLQNDSDIQMSISATTRPKRSKEEDGVDYYFMNEADFEKKIEAKYFYEYAEVFGHLYGTPREKVEATLMGSRDVLFDIDWQGTRRLISKARDDVVSIFILPPSMQELERRLRARAQDSDETIRARMARASDEISHWHEYDYVIINNSLDESLQKVLNILWAERLKRARQLGLPDFIHDMLGQEVV